MTIDHDQKARLCSTSRTVIVDTDRTWVDCYMEDEVIQDLETRATKVVNTTIKQLMAGESVLCGL